MYSVEVVRPGEPAAQEIITAYLIEVASRYHGRPATPEEIEQALRDEPFEDLEGDSGRLLVALTGDGPAACAGVRFVSAGGDGAGADADGGGGVGGRTVTSARLETVGELTKVFTLPAFRSQGLGTLLIAEVGRVCRARGIRTLRLDTRADLVEACALYERLGFERVAPFNDEPYSDRWYSLVL
ncbi:GNAT family N-acetyltransferase [Frigoribacterium faeni]|uniref:GNAT superfamily N-acetyltransferase n=1 Tax=Frigoribacterium faeni TaxID=145483 RepID=A0A7W3JI05_9MICO|nr:GNAT family N-acetyltransferase [Frigoribacterium faeni]MBA8813124.1 GNAT superfamily N-acetyltransferase [Frigoribacterium faeni]BFF14310.1 hypothetical protein GCM10025699_56130 [Microbacterium flavescens]GEK83428.1 hypothetical protein FFA01_17370 [Frigoribacterium faeni]